MSSESNLICESFQQTFPSSFLSLDCNNFYWISKAINFIIHLSNNNRIKNDIKIIYNSVCKDHIGWGVGMWTTSLKMESFLCSMWSSVNEEKFKPELKMFFTSKSLQKKPKISISKLGGPAVGAFFTILSPKTLIGIECNFWSVK